MKGTGRIEIGRADSSRGGAYIRIAVTDDASKTRFVEIKMTLEDFAYAVTSMGRECTFELDADLVDKHREIKDESIMLDDNFGFLTGDAKEKAIDALVAPYEVDGWKASRGDFSNHYHYTYPDAFKRKSGESDPAYHVYCKVMFTRYVDAK
jgi:hypothetical protein